MPLSSRRRQELIAIVSLLAGVFIGLALLPWDITGPMGRAVGRRLWEYFGLGGALIPVMGIATGLAGFGRFRQLGLGRAAVLLAGLVLLVPFALALVMGIRVATDLAASYGDWTVRQQLVGVIPAFVAVSAVSIVGTAGAVIVGVVALSSLTLFTLDWHPFRKLEPGEPKRRSEPGVPSPPETPAGAARTFEDVDDLPAPKRPPRMLKKAARPEEALDELPPIEMLEGIAAEAGLEDDEALDRLGEVLIETLRTFKVEGEIVGRTTGPVVTQFEVKPAPGVKVSKIAALADDLALAMRAKSIRIVAPIPGKAAVGVEVPNPTPRMVSLRRLLETHEWDASRSVLPVVLGRDLEGEPRIADLAKMPHLLIAGATGSGKSVCINTIITSLVYRYTPRELRMLMIDPKMVELSMYNTLPHLRHPVVTDNKQAAQTLKWAMREMDRRYKLFHANTARNIDDFNRKVASGKEMFEIGELGVGSGAGQGKGSTGAAESELTPSGTTPHTPLPYDNGPLPYIVIIVDELADLMMTVQAEVEKPLAILAQKARATGIHLILATQRPSVNVITGLIKANFPSRIAFRVASKVDSRTILDQNGAETLLGNGDMLFLPPGKSEPVRVQGAFIRTEETEDLMEWYRVRKAERDVELERQGVMTPESREEDILEVIAALEAEEAASAAGGGDGASGGTADRDVLFREAAETCIANQLGSTSLLQRKLRIGYGRAARIIDQLYEAGILGPPDGSKAREVLIGMAQVDEYCE
ncbi:MAG: DNA translocase FtsK [Gemmatimonadales bacterium]